MSTPTPTPGRRSAARRTRLNVTTILAVVLPLASVLALLLVRADDDATASHPPTETTLSTATLVCPGPLDDDGLAITSAGDGVDGKVSVGLGDKATDATVGSGRVTTVDAAEGTAVTGTGDLAPGLVAGRTGGDELATAACLPPTAHEWFTGVGAGAGHRSTLELTNPDSGTALADITVLGSAGVVDAPRLRGVSVPGHSTVRLDLAQLIPRKGELALDLLTVRGRVGASLLDTFDRVGSAPMVRDWLPGQTEPEAHSLLMGLAPGSGPRTLVLANGGTDEARVSVKVVTPDSVFAPEGLKEVRVPPQTVKRVTLTSVLGDAIDDDALGLSITSTTPVTSTLRSQVRSDLSHAVPGAAISDAATTLLPEGSARGAGATTKTLALAGAVRAGTVTVESRAADGSTLDSTKVEITPGRGVSVELPATAVLVTITPAKTSVSGAVLVTRTDGATVAPLVVPVTSSLVPAVRPGLP
ncbi:DUF5719 family protein [Nocardioides mangrovi]|uniref:DUF5719 family protein n=1 Tax=Nocardioides mangrovi TaxID=2874580 RepID=A0ABS7U8N1_9ACTN|nr:DUF5719 family protein [Nocardioides mangrovi]MBZ5737335.1 DUF5719 family protein [Nocardioides mangrovi]